MDAGTAEMYLRNLPNFTGIFFARDLDNIALLDYPSAFLIYTDQHWISLYLDSETIEVFDPLGCITNKTLDSVHHFLKFQLPNKILNCTPRVQSANSSNCGKFAICYLYWRLECKQSLSDFLKLFESNQIKNSDIIDALFSAIEIN